ncbi:protein kinase domain-containing protein [Parashewanella tropica]|uniref:protein kinase domain-containing protein n=1 Tax=Parashewanella tropica TaxID=2547970 RepID=UPI0010595C8A|nr:protein kinase family protein [Parashewanella tropica]
MSQPIKQKQPNQYAAHSYTKHFTSMQMLKQEWCALTQCAGDGIQKVIDIDLSNRILTLEFDASYQPLLYLPKSEANIFNQLLPKITALISYCHHKGWIHGDIKPSNILYHPSSLQVKLIDFGASLPIGLNRSSLPYWQCTPSFSSINQQEGKGKVDTNDDWQGVFKICQQFFEQCYKTR